VGGVVARGNVVDGAVCCFWADGCLALDVVVGGTVVDGSFGDVAVEPPPADAAATVSAGAVASMSTTRTAVAPMLAHTAALRARSAAWARLPPDWGCVRWGGAALRCCRVCAAGDCQGGGAGSEVL